MIPGASVVHRDGDSALVLDDRHPRILVVTWFGEPTTGLVDTFFAWHQDHLNAAATQSSTLAVITDTLDAKLPGAVTRRSIARSTAAQQALIERLVVGSIVVVGNAIIRGGLTALGWINPKTSYQAVETCGEAITLATKKLTASGSAPDPFDGANYVRPVDPRAGARSNV